MKAELKGPAADQRQKAVMDKEQMLKLLDSLGSRSEARMWRDAIKTMIVLGCACRAEPSVWRSDPRLDKKPLQLSNHLYSQNRAAMA